jgi:hypothetical protein
MFWAGRGKFHAHSRMWNIAVAATLFAAVFIGTLLFFWGALYIISILVPVYTPG